MFKSKLTNGTANLFAHAQLFKCLQIRLFIIYYPIEKVNSPPNEPTERHLPALFSSTKTRRLSGGMLPLWGAKVLQEVGTNK